MEDKMNIRNFLVILSLVPNLAIPFLAASHCSSSSSSSSDSQSPIFDYIIIGAGTAGCVLAKELSNDKITSVLTLHDGPNLTEDPEIKFTDFIPLTVISGLFDTPLYRNGETVPQRFANNRRLTWAMALPEGGASSVNAGAWCWGTDQVYSQWEAIAGPLWSVSRIRDTYRSLETYHGTTTNPAARGFTGPLSVRQNPEPTTVSQVFTEAIMDATGVPFVLDYNDPSTPIGASSQVQYTQSPDGVLRVSSATAFLSEEVMTPSGRGVNGRKLRVLFNSLALKTIWDGNKAVGVEYFYNGELKKAYANKGVVVSAGVFSSKFLLNSGVGPEKQLEALKVPVIYNNPNVGKVLADQPHIILIFSTDPSDAPTTNNHSIFEQIAWLPTPGGDPNVRTLRMASVSPLPGITAMLLDLVQPKSRGSIAIDNKIAFTDPIVNFGELSNSEDLQLYIKAFQIYVKALNQSLQNINPLYQLIFPDPKILDNTPRLTEFIKQEIAGNQHYQSHCRMAPLDQGGVVDSTGHVYGVENLIVADNSISPVNMDGSPMALAYMIAANIASILTGP